VIFFTYIRPKESTSIESWCGWFSVPKVLITDCVCEVKRVCSNRRQKSALGQQSSTADPPPAQPDSPSDYLHPIEYQETTATPRSDYLHPIEYQEITATPRSDYIHPIEYQETMATPRSDYIHPIEYEEITDTFQRPADPSANNYEQLRTTPPAPPVYAGLRQPDYVNCS